MPSAQVMDIVYVTSNAFKQKENGAFVQYCNLPDGTPVRDLFRFQFRPVPIKEVLEVDLDAMVMAEVTKAYSEIKVPCIVEHAGLIFDGHNSYPGGLTKPMWNELQAQFITETHSAGRLATARAVVAYCDGKCVKTFVGETSGTIADAPRGAVHQFYWDTVFMPNDPTNRATGKTYAQIVEDPALGLKYKMTELSQSTRAMLKFLEYLRQVGHSPLWGRNP